MIGAAIHVEDPTFDASEFWDELLALVDERRVIPIVGADLAIVEIDGVRKPLQRVVGERLAERLRIDTGALPAGFTLNDVACRHLELRGRREEIYPKLRGIVKELQVEPPEPLRKLARIRGFDVYVYLGFDALLVDALNSERFGGAARAEHIGYAPNRVTDLPAARDRLRAPVVYALLGKLSAAPDFVITDEDTLEFLYALQSEARRPHLLFDELQNNHLLVMGCAFPDWLARFFIRIAKSRQLSMQRSESEILVDPRIAADTGLVVFLEHFSYGTRIVPMDAAGFIDELERRWSARHPVAPAAAGRDGPGDALPEMASGSIFLSYASEDLAAAQCISQAFAELGIDIWFDVERLEAGDLYDQKIRRNIRACALFMPVVSRNAEQRVEGYFRREWRLAAERALGIADNVPFILPVVVDDTPPYGDAVPEAFAKAQWTHAPRGQVAPDFAARVVRLVREHRKRERGLA